MMYDRQKTGHQVSDAERKTCYHPAKGFIIALLGCIAAVLGIYGDLFASVVKRQCGIKDYGTIFPGHGGILDRFDSVMFIAPFVTMVITAVFYA